MRVEEYAPAKLTLSLRVLGTRPDGYHDLEALVVAVDEPGDAVLVEPARTGITLRVTGATGGVPADETNLAWRAAAACEASVSIAIVKRIPPRAGLGGGSSDAAAVLRALRDGLGADPGRVVAAAAELGSDVPFCLHGGAAWMRGRGEIVEPVELTEPVRVVIAVPPFGCDTAAVYLAWDELGAPRAERGALAPPSVAPLVAELVNDLEPAAEHLEPRLTAFRRGVETVTGRPALLAGTGSAYAVWFDDPAAWRAAPARLERELGARAYAGIAR